MRISMVAIDNYNYQKKASITNTNRPTIGRLLLENLLGPSNAWQSMDKYTMLKVANSYSRQNNPITIYVTYYNLIISNIYSY